MSIREDIQTVFDKDPAARSTLEVLLCYPGLHAIWAHRIAHALYRRRLYFLARLVSHISRALTGIEIHPGAKIGRRVFIDHGSGVVIGETAEVGDDVLIYMGVVLGGTALERTKRHPTIEDGVIIGSGAIVLGPITVGRGAKIGAGSVVVHPVPPGATVVGVPGRLAGPKCPRGQEKLDRGDLPDPMLRVISRMLDRQNRIEERLRAMERAGLVPGRRQEEIELEERVRAALKEVIDPEVGIDLVDLGLIRGITVRDSSVLVEMVLTTATCPLVDYLTDQVRRRVLEVSGVQNVEVQVLDEPWDWDRFFGERNLFEKT
ncbi:MULTISPECIES: serine O-acetyltransferase [Methanoculleus]|uniref:serine O-acetyltransferase n=1 Tax=Methanoculleus thermophilus TaxID=2200 RepID=A0A1G8ZBL1_9EURY|nr:MULTISPECIES: serine O-acetyltransferase [Methanoculleus]NLN08221.1 serine O-acetyltransferase [Methanoculleus thermophilus]SDK12417.1 serine O-acetyltransferase [Methanoculleus thermophilus]